jgi:hypothetical protein
MSNLKVKIAADSYVQQIVHGIVQPSDFVQEFEMGTKAVRVYGPLRRRAEVVNVPFWPCNCKQQHVPAVRWMVLYSCWHERVR